MEKVKLTDICRPKQWKTISTAQLKESGYPVYGANGKIGFYNEYTHEFPTLLITCRGATCGTVNISEPKSYVNGNAMALDNLSKDYDLKFLYHYFGQRGFNDVISGSAQPQITRENLSKVEVPKINLATQQRIAAILDQADAIIQNNRAIVQKYDALTQSLFLDMFGDPVKNEKRFEKSTVGEQCNVKGGKRVPKNEKLVKENTGFPYIKAGNIKKGKVTTKDLEYLLPQTREKLKRYLVNEGDVCITVVGVNIGDIGIVPKELHKANLTENANKLLINDSKKLNNFYLAFYLQMDFVQQEIKKRTMAVGVPKLALFRIEQIELLLPPLELQNQFAERVAVIESQKQQAQLELAKSEELFNSLLQRAFNGELS